jgi:hypothetical protein
VFAAVLSRASFPAWPGSHARNQPANAASGRTRAGATAVTPEKHATAPAPAATAEGLATSATTPAAISTSPAARRLRPAPAPAPADDDATATARIAATGGTRVARNAGGTEAASVTPTPAASAMTMPPQGTASAVSGSDTPKPLSSAASTLARPSPSATPKTEATAPTSSDSSSTDPNTCPREAPSARMSASARVRCPTMIENVFQITKAPVNSAIPAKPRKKSVSTDSWLFSCCASLAAADAALTATTPDGRTRAIRSRSTEAVTPGDAATEIAS